MVDLVRHIAKFGNRFFWGESRSAARPLLHVPTNQPKVLVVGVYLAEKKNLAEHLVGVFKASRHCDVEQRWIAIGKPPTAGALREHTVASILARTPKFELINGLITARDQVRFDYILVCDDDVTVPPDFIDRFIGWQQYCGFSLAQPARTWRSYVDHPFVRWRPFLRARETSFVEIGPIFCMGRSMASILLPFDQRSAMGWGYDLVWPVIAKRHGLTLGIIDDVVIDHSIRARGQFYAFSAEVESMGRFLAENEHIDSRHAFVTLRRYR